MNYLTRLLLGLGLAIPMSALAAEPPLNWAKSVYLNLGYSAADNALYLKQKNEKCTIGSVNEDGVECVNFAQVKADFPVSDAFVKVLRMDLGGNKFGFRWRTNPDPDMKQSSTLVLASDLDFHELQAGVCVEDHFAPDFTGKVFDGSGYIISNLCKTIDDQTGSSVGLFKEISNAIVKNVAFSDVQFVTSTLNPSDLGTKYYPVGALAGKIYKSEVNGVDLNNVVIQGPLAGGLAGVIEESLISNFYAYGTNNVVKVSNEIQVIDGYVGECEGCGISYTNGYKALVGGLAGVTYQTSFDNINLQVDVRNKAAVDLSSVGGLVGLYVTKGNQNYEDYKEFKINKISIKGPNTATGPVVAGGISMGGLLGEVKRIDSNNYPKSSLIIQEAKVENLKASQSIFKMTLPKATYLGGLIGNGDICNSGKLEISNASVTDFEITEAVKNNGIYQYYIGGIAGYAGCDHVNNSSSTDLYLTLTKSKATGSINLSAKEPDIASTAEVHVSASIGGLVGAAVIAGNEDAVAENEISVGVTYDVKKTNTKIAEASEKVYIGGAFGTVNTYNSSAVVKGLRTTNYIKVVDDGVDSYVGGVIGKFPLVSSGNSKISFKDVQVGPRSSKKSILLDYEAYGTPGYDSYASVGGLCGDCSLIGEIVQSSVKGHFNKLDGANGSFEKKAFSLGGLVGKSRAAEAITVKNTYSNGNISDGFAVEKADEEAPKNKVGYLFGEIPGIQGQKESILISNFHYGVDNVAAIGDADGSSVKNFTEGNFGEFTATNNVRNGAKTELTAKNNGYVSKDYMESSNFAAFLNSLWTESEDMVWAYSNDAGGLPFFGTPSTEQIVSTVPVVFKDGDAVLSVKIGDKVVDVQNVKVGDAAVAPATPAPKDGKCFDKWSEDYTHIMAAVDILAQYKVCTYTVVFTNEDGTKIFDTQTIEYNKNATAPTDLELPEGQCFDSWDGTYTSVKSDLTIKAKTAPCTYTVKFTDEAGIMVFKTQTVEYNKNATAPTDLELPEGQCFDSWDGTYTSVKSDLTIKAKTAPCTYTVKFTDEAGTKVFKTQTVEYNKDATAPTDLELPEGKCFDSWDGTYTNVKSDLTVKVKTKACGNSSSSSSGNTSESSSSSSAGNGGNSSSAGNGNASSSSAGNDSSSSSEDKSSSSSATLNSSSSVNDESSSSIAEHKKYLLEIAEPMATQDGNALRMEFGSQLANASENVNIHIQVVSKNGIYLDTTVNGKAVSDVKNGTWRLDPAPAGRYTVTFTITDGVDSIPVPKTFTSMESREVASHSWQTLSLSAFCREKGDECMSDLEAFFARHRDKAEGDVESETSVYWWDESNPVGDYWQYRKFSVNDKFDSTRGYWYGPIDNEPLVMSLETPDMKDEIVWKLENKYSGWNLVANPFGWYVTLPKEKGLQFYKWDPEVCSYKEPDTLGPYEAIWVRTEKSMTYRIPLKAAIVLEEEKKSLNKSVAAEEWNLRVVLADNNGKRDSWNELAAGKTASTLGEPPAGMGDRVNLSIMDGKKRLVKSVKKNADDLEWDLEVSATTSREGHLSFEGLESVWSKGLRVYATVDNETVEVVKDSPMDVKLSSKAKNVSVRVTKSAVAANVAKNLLKGLHVGQMSNMLNVGFDAASKLAGANVKVSVVGIDGRVVATNRAVAREGSNAVSMKKPKQGVYFVKVKVGSQSAVTRIMVR
ncbi:hypothetical protein FSU_2546 [Fibrobacter succinogenes subsp. succinogenes S85]|uniref:Por secretion system C-terminal sorting domain-containing protein n=1 Tax=Fibrobacter succinogenes (strain ATCC 19169 / S85) TaxID=59374 RepID=D9S5H9_FIBSS|nr:T9SS type A sorting domain-containing protein [Fibrobacter succinogenes]ADL27390.1 hypothetical protein FSU_2546 [Fibrobacter succinogenes subsp. succinogenes S85]